MREKQRQEGKKEKIYIKTKKKPRPVRVIPLTNHRAVWFSDR